MGPEVTGHHGFCGPVASLAGSLGRGAWRSFSKLHVYILCSRRPQIFNQSLTETIIPSNLQESTDFIVWELENLGKRMSDPGSPRDHPLQRREFRRSKVLNNTFFFLNLCFPSLTADTCLLRSVEKVTLVQGHIRFPSDDGRQLWKATSCVQMR